MPGIVPLVHLTRLDSYGVAWRSFMEPFFDSCGVMRDVVISIMATLAEQERISISERTKAGLVRAVKAGRTLGRRPVAVDVARARKMRKAGLGLRLVAKKLGCSVNAHSQSVRRGSDRVELARYGLMVKCKGGGGQIVSVIAFHEKAGRCQVGFVLGLA